MLFKSSEQTKAFKGYLSRHGRMPDLRTEAGVKEFIEVLRLGKSDSQRTPMSPKPSTLSDHQPSVEPPMQNQHRTEEESEPRKNTLEQLSEEREELKKTTAVHKEQLDTRRQQRLTKIKETEAEIARITARLDDFVLAAAGCER